MEDRDSHFGHQVATFRRSHNQRHQVATFRRSHNQRHQVATFRRPHNQRHQVATFRRSHNQRCRRCVLCSVWSGRTSGRNDVFPNRRPLQSKRARIDRQFSGSRLLSHLGREDVCEWTQSIPALREAAQLLHHWRLSGPLGFVLEGFNEGVNFNRIASNRWRLSLSFVASTAASDSNHCRSDRVSLAMFCKSIKVAFGKYLSIRVRKSLGIRVVSNIGSLRDSQQGVVVDRQCAIARSLIVPSFSSHRSARQGARPRTAISLSGQESAGSRRADALSKHLVRGGRYVSTSALRAYAQRERGRFRLACNIETGRACPPYLVHPADLVRFSSGRLLQWLCSRGGLRLLRRGRRSVLRRSCASCAWRGRPPAGCTGSWVGGWRRVRRSSGGHRRS